MAGLGSRRSEIGRRTVEDARPYVVQSNNLT